MPDIGTYSDYTPAGSARVYRVTVGASPAHPPENFQKYTDQLEKSLASALFNKITATSYDFVRADAGRLTEFNNAAAVAAVIPLQATVAFLYPDPPTTYEGSQIGIANIGAGTVTVTCPGGTISGADLTLGQYERGT